MGDAGPALHCIWGPTLMKCGRQGFPVRAEPEDSHLETCQKIKANTQCVSYRGPLGYLSDQHPRERANKNDCSSLGLPSGSLELGNPFGDALSGAKFSPHYLQLRKPGGGQQQKTSCGKRSQSLGSRVLGKNPNGD